MAKKEKNAEIPVANAEQLKRSKRSKIVLIFIVIILLIALGGLVYLGYQIYNEALDRSKEVSQGAPERNNMDGGSDISASGIVDVETVDIPDLNSLFGLGAEEVTAKLGSDFQLTSSKPITDETNTDIKQLVTYTHTPKVEAGTSSAAATTNLPTESIYASLNEEGKVIDIYYTADMRLLGYPDETFDTLLATDTLVMEALSSAGITARDFVFASPGEESVIYDNKDSANRKITKQTQIYSGRTAAESGPSAWTLTVTYDFGIAGVESKNDYRQATRMLSLRLA